MIPGHLTEEVLQQLHDGELGADQDAARQHVQGCAECRKQLEQLEKLHDLINLAAEDMSSEVDFDALYGRITEGVSDRGQAAGQVVSLQSWRERFRTSGAHVWLPMAVAAAVVIGVIAEIASPGGGDDEPQADRRRAKKTIMVAAPGKTAQLPGLAPPSEQPEPPNSEISQVDFGESNGTVFEIALADGISTPVVWINDEPQDTVAP